MEIQRPSPRQRQGLITTAGVELTFDVSITKDHARIAAVCTNRLGSCIQAWTASVSTTDLTLREALAAALAVNSAKNAGFPTLQLGGDSMDSIVAIQTGETTDSTATDELLSSVAPAAGFFLLLGHQLCALTNEFRGPQCSKMGLIL